MFSEKLEEFIEAALADGVLTDKKREILHKRAIKEGVDVDELDMVLDARLAKMKTPPPPKPVMNNIKNAHPNSKPKNEFGITESIDKKIQMILEDGEISDEDRQYIHECAKEEGVSEKDVDFYMNRLIKKQQKEQQKGMIEKEVEYEKKKKEDIGNICPKCGKQIPPMSLKCPHCGMEVVSKKANSSAQELLKKIEAINNDYVVKYSNPMDAVRSKLVSKYYGLDSLNGECERRIMDTITMFPIPNTKEDIIEFLSLITPNAKKKGGILGTIFGRFAFFTALVIIFAIIIYIQQGNTYGFDDHELIGKTLRAFFLPFIFLVLPLTLIIKWDKETLRWNKRAKVWRAKFDQILMKGRSIQGDSDFQKQLDYYENQIKK